MSRLKSKISKAALQKLVGRVTVYRSRLGKFRYRVIFHGSERVFGKKVALVYPHDGFKPGQALDGWFTGVNPDNIPGKRVRLSEVPTQIIEDIQRHI